MESNGELMFSWYCMDNVLEPGAAEAMFNDYCAILCKPSSPPLKA